MEDYKIRMVNEYRELQDRINKLGAIINKATDGTLDFDLNCPLRLLQLQYDAMWTYKSVLLMRAEIEQVEL